MILPNELIIDNFAGGGGASLGIEMALGRSPDIAINHDPEAIAMHAANHPNTRHYCKSIYQVDPDEIMREYKRPVGLMWASPDCTHHSKARGGKPRKKHIRDLAWTVVHWAKVTKARVVIMENVEEFKDWGPLTADGQPCPIQKGLEFNRWIKAFKKLGYKIEWRELRACDYGAPTIRKRLFLIARRDGEPIVWPAPTHGKGLTPYRTAAECIDWSIPCHSIFLTREEGRAVGCNRPLAENTMRRIARGVKRYVLDASEPFIVNLTHQGGDRNEGLSEPFRTVTGAHRGEKALVSPVVTKIGQTNANGKCTSSADEPLSTVVSKNEHCLITSTLIQTGYGERDGQQPRVPGLDKPLGTVVAGGGKHAIVSTFLAAASGPAYSAKPRAADKPIHTITGDCRAGVVAAFLAQHNNHGTGEPNVGRSVADPISTITTSGTQQQLVASSLVKLKGTCRDGQALDKPMPTVQAQGLHIGEVRAFLLKYFSTEQDPRLEEPLHTVTAKDRFGLVMVHGEPYMIVDIGMRMLTPRELYRAQGFRQDYIIDPIFNGKPLTKTSQVRMCGNSVSPNNAAALAGAQFSIQQASVA